MISPGAAGFSPTLMAGKTVVITAAGGAICGASAVMMAAAGADLVLTDRNSDRLERVAEQVRMSGGRVVTLCADLQNAETVGRLKALAMSEFGRVDVLINGLGEHLASAAPMEETTEDQWQSLYEVNLLHIFRTCRTFIGLMKAQGWGRIVNFSSVEGNRAAPDLAIYAAFKRAVDGFTRSLAVELAPFGILVNAIAVDKTRAHQVNHYELPAEYARLVPTWIPAGRYGEPNDVAAIVVFLGSGLNTWIVGDTINADGGTLAAGGWYRTPARWTNQPLLTQYLEDSSVNDSRPQAVR